MKTGIHMMVASFVRPHPNNNMTKSKVAGNYVNSLLVKTLALRSGYDEAVILDTNGFVAECTGENLFMVRHGVISTPPISTVLEGITRDSVLTLAVDLGIPFEECLITRDQLYIADEVFHHRHGSRAGWGADDRFPADRNGTGRSNHTGSYPGLPPGCAWRE